MSRPALPFSLPLEQLHVTPWHDPVVDAVGHDLRSPYVERYWLALLGPSTVLLLRRLAIGLAEHPDGFVVDLEETARSIGLGLRGGAGGPFLRAVARTGQFHISRPAGEGAIEVRTRVQTLTHHQVSRLPQQLQEEHAEWQRQARAEPTVEERRTRARRLALSLLELGETPDEAELQLHRWKVHPALAHEAMRWATARRDHVTSEGSLLASGSATATPAAGTLATATLVRPTRAAPPGDAA